MTDCASDNYCSAVVWCSFHMLYTVINWNSRKSCSFFFIYLSIQLLIYISIDDIYFILWVIIQSFYILFCFSNDLQPFGTLMCFWLIPVLFLRTFLWVITDITGSSFTCFTLLLESITFLSSPGSFGLRIFRNQTLGTVCAYQFYGSISLRPFYWTKLGNTYSDISKNAIKKLFSWKVLGNHASAVSSKNSWIMHVNK